jgi:hypothetical protein
MKWLTNDPEAAKKIIKADKDYAKARAAAVDFPLAEKIEAYRVAKEAREIAYKAVRS